MPLSEEQISAYKRKLDTIANDAASITEKTRAKADAVIQKSRQRIGDKIKKAAPDGKLLAGKGAQLRDFIESELNDTVEQVQLILISGERQAWDSGIAAANQGAEILGVPTFNTLSTNLIASTIGYSADFVQTVQGGLFPKMNSIITQAVTGAIDPYKAMQQLDLLVGNDGDGGVSFQAERIIRTEIGRVRSTALQAQMQNIINISPEFVQNTLKKEWVSGPSRNGRRWWHQEMDGDKVLWNDKFETPLGNFLRFPRDPEAPAEETILCGCTMQMDSNSLFKAAKQVLST